MNENPDFLRKKYPDLNASPEVASASKRTQAQTGEVFPMVSQEDADRRIQNYLDRFNKILERKNPEERERGIDALKNMLHNKYVITSEEIPEAYFESIKQKHRKEGHGDIEIPDEYRCELSNTLIKDQEKSLNKWIDYLSTDGAKYPDYLRYFAIRSIVHMGRYDKKKKSFTERTGGSLSPFPEINREALAVVLGDLEKQQKEDPKLLFTGRHDISQDTKDRFKEFLKNKNFSKLYALALDAFKPIPEELLKITEGKWVVYPKGSNHMPLVNSISEHGTGWCLRGEEMAERYLSKDNNELSVYYSLDKKGQPTVPRVVVVKNPQGKITEVRGVAEDENLDPYITPVVETKLKEFGSEGDVYKKKSSDMKVLTVIEQKTKKGEQLTKNDLIFLYEINSKIEGFGYDDDPRVKELREKRNLIEDMPIVFECLPEQIAHSPSEVTENTKAYVGELFNGIFQKNIEHIYTSFPEGKLMKYEIELGKTKEQYEKELNNPKYNFYSNAKDIFKKDWAPAKNSEKENLIRLTVKDMGFSGNTTTEQVYKKAKELGLELCLPETGPALRLSTDSKDYMVIGMEPISDSDGDLQVFSLRRNGAELALDTYDGKPSHSWDDHFRFVFRTRKLESEPL